MKNIINKIFSGLLAADMILSPMTSFQVNAEDSGTSPSSPSTTSNSGTNTTGTSFTDVTVTYTVIGADAQSSYTPSMHLYANGADANQTAEVTALQNQYLNAYAESSAAFKQVAATDSNGGKITYTVADAGYQASGDFVQFAFDAQGNTVTADANGQYPADTLFVYVKRTAVSGTIHVDQGLTDTSKVSITVSASAADAVYAGNSAAAVLTLASGSADGTWSASSLLSVNPATGKTIDYKAVISGLDGYTVTYDNTGTAYAALTDGAYNGGKINVVLPAAPASKSMLFGATDPNLQSVKLSKVWNDNNDEHKSRPTLADFDSSFKLTYSIDDGNTYKTLTTDNMSELGLTAMPIRSIDTSSYNTWVYTYAAMPTTVTINGVTHTVKYGAIESAVSGYQASGNDGKQDTITNTYLTSFKANKIWFDNANAYATRPTAAGSTVIDAWKNGYIHFFVRKDGDDIAQATEITDASLLANVSVTSDAANSVWTINFSNLPAYDTDGYPLIYHMTEDLDKLNQVFGNSSDKYISQYTNTGNYASDTTHLFNDGQLTNTLTNVISFTITKNWKDGLGTGLVSTRPNAVMYLYRFAEGVGSYDTASPVQGFDSASVPKQDGDITFGLDATLGAQLPKYDSEGHKYTYFVKEIITDTDKQDYKQFIDNKFTENVPEDCVLNSGIITNKKSADFDASAVKNLQAVAMQADYATVTTTFQLQRRVKGTTTDWTDVTDQNGATVTTTVTGFAEGSLTQDGSFGSMPKYDDEGVAYEYRSVETAMSIGGQTVTMAPYYTDDGTLPAVLATVTVPGTVAPDGTTAKFEVIRNDDGSITDRLIGNTQIVIKKSWSPANETGTAVFHIIRSDSKTSLSAGATGDDATTIKTATGYLSDVTLTGDSTLTLSNLDRYDENGREYTYTVKEVSASDGYTLTGESYQKQTVYAGNQYITSLNASYTNSNKPGTDMTFELDKSWLDDGDLLHENPVQVGIYRISGTGTDKTLTLVQEVTLNSANLWKTKVSIAKQDDQDVTSNYIVLEEYVDENGTHQAVQGLQTTYTLDQLTALRAGSKANILAGTATKEGSVTTTQHYYNAYTYLSDSSDTYAKYTVTNQRYGYTVLNLTKTWVTPLDTVPTATFQIIRKDADLQNETIISDIKGKDSFTMTLGTNKTGTWSSTGYIGVDQDLPKYDASGRAYVYSIKEIKMDDQTIDSSGHATIGTDQYSSSVSGGDLIKDDTNRKGHYEWSAVNTRSETIHLSVNKIWQDDGSDGTPMRPDIYFNVYRTSAAKYTDVININTADLSAAITADPANIETVSINNIWNTKINDWYWTNDLGDFARYDAQGRRYVYFLKETMLSNAGGVYGTVYCNGKTKPINTTTAASTEDTFTLSYKDDSMDSNVLVITDGTENDPSAVDSYSKTTVNYRAQDRNVSGIKIWKNLPASFKRSNLPDITIDLYRSTSSDKAVLYDAANKTISTVLNSSTTSSYSFVKGNTYNDSKVFDGMRYDSFGRMYYYGVKEAATPDGYQTYVEQAANDFVMTNTYKLSDASTVVNISVSKTWSVTDAYKDRLKASVTFTLYRSAADANGNIIANSEETVNEYTMDPGTTEESTTTKTYTFTTDNANPANPLPYYAPNGNPYKYYVVEKVPAGYTSKLTNSTAEGVTTTLSTGALKLSRTDETKPYTNNIDDASFTNTYTPGTVDVTATKVWNNDSSDAYGTRPSAISLQLKRTYKKVDGTDNTETVGDPYKLSKTENPQSHTFTGLQKYAPNGTEYSYFVEESASGTADTEALNNYTNTVTSGNTATTITNSLPTTSIKVAKIWKERLGTVDSVMTNDEIKRLCALNAFPASITFEIQYSDDDGTTWQNLNYTSVTTTQVKSYTFTLNNATTGKNDPALVEAAVSGHTISGLPKYKAGTNSGTSNYRLYKAVEQETSKPFITHDTNTKGINSGTYAITNILPVREAEIDKVWDDNDDRDATRPTSLSVHLTRDTSSTLDLSLSSANQKGTDVNTWSTGVFYVPLYQNGSSTEYSTYAATETTPTNYTPSSTVGYPKHTENDFDALKTTTNYNYFSFTNKTNETERSSITVTANKVWNGDSVLTSTVRPANVYFTLKVKDWDDTTNQYKNTWSTATAENCGLSGTETATKTLATGSATSVAWTGIWKYHAQTTATPVAMLYQVVETDASGNTLLDTYPYTPSYSTTSISGTDSTPAVTVTNTLKKVSTDVRKTWHITDTDAKTTDAEMTTEQKTAYYNAGLLPKYIRYTVQYSTDGEVHWYDVTKTTTTGTETYTVDADLSSLQKLLTYTGSATAEDLPQYTSNRTSISYRMNETAVSYDTGTAKTWVTPANAGFTLVNDWDGRTGSAATNTFAVGSVTVSKNWLDEADRDGKRSSSITVQLYRDGSADANKYGSPVVIQKKADGTWPSYTWTDLPVYQNNSQSLSSYTIVETAVTDYNQPVYSSTSVQADQTNADPSAAGSTITVTNKYDPARFTITANKVWSDYNNAYASRPAGKDVTFTLQYQDTDSSWKNVTTATLTNNQYVDDGIYTTSTNPQTLANGLTVTWANVSKNRPSGTAVTYRVVETSTAKNYDISYSLSQFTGAQGDVSVTITNTLETISTTVEKTWLIQGTNYGSSMGFTNMEQYFDAGLMPKYLRYTVQSSTDDGDTWQNVTKTTAAGTETYTVDADLSSLQKLEKYKTSTTANDLPKVTEDGTAIIYRMIETAVKFDGDWIIPENASIYSENYGDTESQTNNTIRVGAVTVSKVWLDEADRDGKRSGSITVQLQRDGSSYGDAVTINKNTDGTWPSYTWTDLPIYQNQSTSKSSYAVVETAVDGYQTTYSGSVPADPRNHEGGAETAADSTITVTNTHVPNTYAISANKVWEDNNDAYSLRPAGKDVTFTLQYLDAKGVWQNVVTKTGESEKYPDDGVYTTSVNPQTLGSGSTVQWLNIRRYYASGTAVTYRVAETGSTTNYQTTYLAEHAAKIGQEDGSFQFTDERTANVVVTNTITKTNLEVVKKWADYDNKYLTRPSADLEVQLQSRISGTEEWQDVAGKTALLSYDSASGTWKNAAFTDLPVKDKAGNYLEYQAVETKVPEQYTAASADEDGSHCAITNTIDMTKRYAAVIHKHSITTNGALLDGAGYVIRRQKDPELKVSALPQTAEIEYEYYQSYDADTDTAIWTDDRAQAKMFVTGTDVPYVLGQVTVPGLSIGYYSIIEVQAPKGYDLNDGVDFVIDGTTAVADVPVSQADPLLPETTNTGDQTAISLWMSLFFSSIGLAAAILYFRRRTEA